ncbi:MAG TPA: tryptophan synthase subunit beta [Gammaproteobacteria bacterium]|jgi:tryptophan synthase beta subunit|nr:tryptophan synthase subunit beta [Gammaproteobacteria bacterium]
MSISLLQNTNGRYGGFGGMYIPEILIEPIRELIETWNQAKHDSIFRSELSEILKNYAGRPTALTEVPSFSKKMNGPRVFLKREDLLHTGAHKLNNALGQCLLAKKMGKTRVVAETGAGQHGVATAAACARLGLECVIYMGSVDMERQAPNVSRMKLMGATVIPAECGSATLKDAVNEALRDWSASFSNTHYCLGSALGPYPFPEIVSEFQSVIGSECREQCEQQIGVSPNLIIACVGGGSNAIGLFSGFLDDDRVRMIGVEGGGHGSHLGEHAARFAMKTPGVLHGCYTYVLQNEHGQIAPTSSISAGLDYPAVGPQHVHLFESGRAEYVFARDDEAVDALKMLAATEGIICALESAHALAHLIKIAPTLPKNNCVVVNLSGRGDKDLSQLMSRGMI